METGNLTRLAEMNKVLTIWINMTYTIAMLSMHNHDELFNVEVNLMFRDIKCWLLTIYLNVSDTSIIYNCQHEHLSANCLP